MAQEDAMTEAVADAAQLTADEQEWPSHVTPPPTDLPHDDGERMETPWHAHSAMLLKSSYAAAHGNLMTDYYIGINMFVYYSWKQVRNLDYRGPDWYFVKNVDGTKPRLYWAIWEEDGRYPDVIIELLSESTEKEDLGKKKDLYEQTFHTAEYFCIAPQVERLLGWRRNQEHYTAIEPNEHGWLWSEQLGFWIGAWHGTYMADTHTWPRLFNADETLALTPEEAERERAETERERAETERERAETERERADGLADRVAALEAELRRLKGEA